jgi:glycolate oxidase FAD binding subunit
MRAVVGLEDLLPPEALGSPHEPPSGLVHLGSPESVVRPASVDDVVTVMRWATQEGVGVLPLRSGQRARPVSGFGPERGRWIALCTERLAGIEIYEAADLTLTAGAGTPVRDLDVTLRANGQWAPFDPPAFLDRSLGGLVAAAPSGTLAAGYGELRNHVLGMTVVTGDGRVLRLGGRVVKNVAGFDLIKPMTGSRGSLAVMTSICLRAFPVPQCDLVLMLAAASAEELAGPAVRVVTAPVMPVATVVVDRLASAAGAAALLVRLHGAPAAVEADRRTIEQQVGRTFEAIDGGARDAVLEESRGHGENNGVTLLASAAPSRLDDLISAIRRAGPTSFAVDPHPALARVAFDSVDRNTLRALTREVESLGGAVRLESLRDATLRNEGTQPTRDEARLVERLRGAFDPGGVLWPARA